MGVLARRRGRVAVGAEDAYSTLAAGRRQLKLKSVCERAIRRLELITYGKNGELAARDMRDMTPAGLRRHACRPVASRRDAFRTVWLLTVVERPGDPRSGAHVAECDALPQVTSTRHPVPKS